MVASFVYTKLHYYWYEIGNMVDNTYYEIAKASWDVFVSVLSWDGL